MKNVFVIFILLTLVSEINGQSIEAKIETLLKLDGTIQGIEDIIEQNIDSHKKTNLSVSDQYWQNLLDEIKKLSVYEFIKLINPAYQSTFTEVEIDGFIKFYSSDIGKQLIIKRPELYQEIQMPIAEWSQNLNTIILERVKNHGKKTPDTKEISALEKELMKAYGLQIINMSELSIDSEQNLGTLLLNFGEIDGSTDVTKEIIVKNNTDSLIIFNKPLFLFNDEIYFDWGNAPLKPNEVRALKFTLNHLSAEGQRYCLINLDINGGIGFPVGIKYSAPLIPIEYSISSDSLPFKKFKGKYSKEYKFRLINKGNQELQIANITSDKSYALIGFTKEKIKQGEAATITIVFIKDLINNFNEAEVKLELEVYLTKSKPDYQSGLSEKFTLKIF